jgi:hypothetical protein
METERMMFFVCICTVLLALPPCVLGTRDVLVEYYFNVGYDYGLIVCFLHFLHGITISLRQLKRILRRLGLRRRTLQDRTLLLDTLRVIEVGLLHDGRYQVHDRQGLGVLFLESNGQHHHLGLSCAHARSSR